METWIDSTSATAASKTSFMETTDDNYIPLPLQHLVSNQDTGYDTNTGGTLSLMSSQDLTSFSTSIQAPQQNLQKPVVGLKVSFKVPPTFCFPNKDYITMSEPATLLERESMKMGVCADTVPISNNLKEAPKTEWTPLVSSTPSREQY